MPIRAPRLCQCGNLVGFGARCPCRQRDAAARKARFDRKRPSSSARGYNRQWEAARLRFLAANGLCALCGAHATVVDHIRPHRRDAALFWDSSNWQALCSSCHNSRKQRQERAAK